ncbi:MAG: hypothetical protein HY721_01155 [Planctomycetes bacterium]|nr:hypothetical protein [Planctomycetota bacterium]
MMRFHCRLFLVLATSMGFLASGTPFLRAQDEEPAPEEKEAPEAELPEAETEVPETEVPEAETPGAATAETPTSGQFWVVDFELKALRMIAPKEGVGAGSVYWYMLYTLSNSAKEDRQVFVNITATSDGGKRYADLYLPAVERAIERKENTPLWGKEDEFKVLAKRKPKDPKYHYLTLKAGEKRSCVAVFNRLEPTANKVTVRVAGLSNEVREVVKDDGSRLLEERVRELRFERPGDEHAMSLDSFKLVGKDWVKRQIPAAPAAEGAVAPSGSK